MDKPKFSKTLVALAAVGLLLSGCATSLQMTELEQKAVGTSWNAAVPESRLPSVSDAKTWWASWNDPELTRLINLALEANTDIGVAKANLKAAAALSDEATANLFPSASLSGDATRSRKNNKTTETYSAGGSVTWSFSLVGGNIAAQRAANREALASAMTLEDTKIAVASEVAQNYINLKLAEVKLAIAQKTAQNYAELSEIAHWRLAAGLATQTEADQADSNRDLAKAQIPVCESSIAKYRNAIARLCVVNASEVEKSTSEVIPEAPSNIAVSVPADTLRQRPDMRSAEYAVLAAYDRVYEAKTKWFPSLKLSGNLGTQAATIGALGASGTGIATLIGALSMPLFNWADQVSTVTQKEASLDKAKANYTATLVKALEETENALEAISASERRMADLKKALEVSQSAADLAQIEYKAGLSDYQTVLNTQRTLFSAQETLESNRADRSTNYIKLYTSLGGGWTAPKDEDS